MALDVMGVYLPVNVIGVWEKGVRVIGFWPEDDLRTILPLLIILYSTLSLKRSLNIKSSSDLHPFFVLLIPPITIL